MSRALMPKEQKRPDAELVAPVTPPDSSAPAAERIAQLAYSYWEDRGRQGGSPEEDWYRAIEELNNRPSRMT